VRPGLVGDRPVLLSFGQKVYLDLSFFRELDRRFGAPGDFAQAYVIAHEVGHHVQRLTGALSSGEGLSKRSANAQSVRQELQADCLAGVWGHAAASRNRLDPDDAEEGCVRRRRSATIVCSAKARVRWFPIHSHTARPPNEWRRYELASRAATSELAGSDDVNLNVTKSLLYSTGRRGFLTRAGVAGMGLLASRLPLDAQAPDLWTEAAAILRRIKAPVFPNRTFEITRYGAAPDKDATAAIRAAIDAATLPAVAGRRRRGVSKPARSRCGRTSTS
jgi:hypothetical protein